MTDYPLKHQLLPAETQKLSSSPLEASLEEEIETYLDSLSFETDDPLAAQLTSRQYKRNQLKASILEEAQCVGLCEHLSLAVTLVQTEGMRFLDKAVYEILLSDLESAGGKISQLTAKDLTSLPLWECLDIKVSSMNALMTLAKGTFAEQRFHDSLALCTLLLTLAPDEADYWFHAGMAAQQIEDYEFAVKAYEAAIALDDALVGPRIFLTECLFVTGRYSEAEEAFSKAKELADKGEKDPLWQALLPQLENWLHPTK